MAEEKIENKKTEDINDEQVEDIQADGTSTDEVVKTENKAFSQQEVNRIVQNRLKKVKTDYETQIEQYEEQVSKYEDVLNNLINSQLANQTESVKKLLAKLPILDQLDWLNENLAEENKQAKRTIPTTPKAEQVKEDKTPKKVSRIF